MPAKPISVKTVSPLPTVGEFAVVGSHQAVDDPRLPPDLATTHPASLAMYGNGISSIRIQSIQRARQSRPASATEPRAAADRNKNRAQTNHDVIGVIRELDRRPKIASRSC